MHPVDGDYVFRAAILEKFVREKLDAATFRAPGDDDGPLSRGGEGVAAAHPLTLLGAGLDTGLKSVISYVDVALNSYTLCRKSYTTPTVRRPIIYFCMS